MNLYYKWAFCVPPSLPQTQQNKGVKGEIMERKFTLSCCSTVDLPYSYMESRDIPVLFYTYVVDGQTYDDDMGRDPAALPRFTAF